MLTIAGSVFESVIAAEVVSETVGSISGIIGMRVFTAVSVPDGVVT